MASASRVTASCFRYLRTGPRTFASSSMAGPSAVTFSTRSSNLAESTPQDVTAIKSPHSAASENLGTSVPAHAGQGRKSAGRGRPKMLPPFPEWMAGPGKQYREPRSGMGPNWIADTPFPLNPSFNPPPPLRQSLKNEIWQLHTTDPAQWTIRALSEKFNVGNQRMEAVLRLKALEVEMKQQGKALQTEFQHNMDRLLGARERTREADAVPATRSTDRSSRGPQHEEFDESKLVDTPSVIAPALEQSVKVRKSMINSLPSGGPDTTGLQRTVIASENKQRATISITKVHGDSYQGAGRVERNIKGAKKRSTMRAEKRTAKQSRAKQLKQRAEK